MIPLYSLSVTEFRRRIRFHPRRKCILFLIYLMQEEYFWPPRTLITGRHAAKLGSYASFLRSVRIIKWQVQRHNVYERSKATACEAHKSPRIWIGCRCCRNWEGLTNRSRIVVPCQIIVSFGVSVFEKQKCPFSIKHESPLLSCKNEGKGVIILAPSIIRTLLAVMVYWAHFWWMNAIERETNMRLLVFCWQAVTVFFFASM